MAPQSEFCTATVAGELSAAVLDSCPIAFAMFDADLRCVSGNHALRRVSPLDGADWIGRGIAACLPDALSKPCTPSIRAAVQHGRITENLELVVSRDTDTPTVWLCTVAPVRDERSDAVFAGLWLVEVTEQALATERLLETERRFRRLTENARDIVYRMSLPDGCFEYVSPSCEDITGYPPEVFYASPGRIRELVHPDSEVYFQARWQRLMEGHIPDYYEYQIVDTAGRTRWLQQRAVVVRDERGQPVALEGIVRDVSDVKTAQQALRAHEHKLMALSSRLALTEEDVRRRVAQDVHDGVAQTLIAAQMHLARLPARFAGGQLEPLRLVREHLEQAIEDCRTIALDLSSPVLHEHGLGQAVALLAKRVADRMGIHCRLDLDERDLGLSHELRIALFQAVRELLINVEKHSRASEVSIAIHRQGDQVNLSFRDNGVGCEGPQRAMPPPDGGGFGLFAIREQIAFLGGSVSIECAPGDGCSIMLQAPCSASRRAVPVVETGPA